MRLVEGREPHQPVDAALAAQVAVGVRPRNLDGALLMPASSPSVRSSMSHLKPWRSAQRRYIRRSISAQSCASVPPAPAWIRQTAFCRVILPPKAELELQLRRALLDSLRLGRDLGAVSESSASGQLQSSSASSTRFDRLIHGYLVAQAGGRLCVCAFGVVPELGRGWISLLRR